MSTSSSSAPRPLLLVRKPSPLLSEGQLTHLTRDTSSPPTHAASLKQWQAYVSLYARQGWEIIYAPEADDCPDGVFLEDAIIVFPNLSASAGTGSGGVVVLPRSGSVERRKEYPSAKRIVEESLVPRGFQVFDFEKEDISGQATCDGGDILKVYQSNTVYIGQSTRTNQLGFSLLKGLLQPRGWNVVGVSVKHHLHLKSAITALPTGQIIGNFKPRPASNEDDNTPNPGVQVPGQTILPIQEEQGIAVVDLSTDGPGNDNDKNKKILISSKAPSTIEQLRKDGWDVHLADVDEFEKMEGCVTCLSVRVRTPAPSHSSSS